MLAMLALRLATAAGGALWLLSIYRTTEAERMRLGGWTAGQAEIEGVRLQRALDRLVLGDPTIDASDAALRLEIFWSRLNIILESSEGEPVREVPGAVDLVSGIVRQLPTVLQALRAQAPRPEALERARQRVGTWLLPLRELVVQVSRVRDEDAVEQEILVLERRSEERRVGKECVSTCSTRG